MPAKNEINLSLTVDETNTIIEALGQLPFMRAYKIIEKIHIQAQTNAVKLPKKTGVKKK
jgi:hypothetical protein